MGRKRVYKKGLPNSEYKYGATSAARKARGQRTVDGRKARALGRVGPDEEVHHVKSLKKHPVGKVKVGSRTTKILPKKQNRRMQPKRKG
jgi:hypothetical protein